MFQPARKVKKSLKVAVFGESGVGKTWFALQAPGCKAVIDTENGTDFYGGKFDFEVIKTRRYTEVMKALDYIEANADKYDVLIIDPITNIYQVLKDAGQLSAERRAQNKGKSGEDAALTFRDWGIIKNKFNSLISRLCNLPCHVIMTGWIKDIYEGSGDSMKKVGARIDADKKVEYQPDVIIHLEVDRQGNRYGVIEKDRTMTHKIKERVKDINFSDFIAASSQEGEASPLQIDSEVAEAEAEITAETAEEIKKIWLEKGLKPLALNAQVRRIYQCGFADMTQSQGQEFLDKLIVTKEVE
ncbi:ATP-binding protein [Marininema mesophilum]|nr:ATP-binding protein [Marininema mesophilum]